MPNLANGEMCTGCSSCANVCPKNAIRMVADNEGFLQPVIDGKKCVNCGLCERSCPTLSLTEMPLGATNPRVYAGWHKQDRGLCSSGGIFSALARNVIKKGGIVFGAILDNDFNCKHIAIEQLEDLDKLRGSKYIQSSIGNTFCLAKEYLKNDRLVLFSGTPCQIAGLKAFLKKDYANLLTIDLACHGVPSNTAFKSYLNKLQSAKKSVKNVKKFSFRLPDGWGKTSRIQMQDGSWKSLYGVDALYMSAFDKNALFRKSCYTCQYTKIPRIGDVSLADFWGIGQAGVPFKHDVMKGVSLVFANTPKGVDAIEKIGEDSFIEERTLKEALANNHNLRAPSEKFGQRDAVIEAFLDENISLHDIDRKYGLTNHGLKALIKEYSSKLGAFDIAKRIYNKVKSL